MDVLFVGLRGSIKSQHPRAYLYKYLASQVSYVYNLSLRRVGRHMEDVEAECNTQNMAM